MPITEKMNDGVWSTTAHNSISPEGLIALAVNTYLTSLSPSIMNSNIYPETTIASVANATLTNLTPTLTLVAEVDLLGGAPNSDAEE